jgi:hypothetical protein
LATLKTLTAGALLAGCTCLVDLPVTQADPLIPPTPAEIEYLEHLHHILPGTGDLEAFHSDGVLLDRGRLACYRRDQGFIGYRATYVSPVIAQVAFADLCPR